MGLQVRHQKFLDKPKPKTARIPLDSLTTGERIQRPPRSQLRLVSARSTVRPLRNSCTREASADKESAGDRRAVRLVPERRNSRSRSEEHKSELQSLMRTSYAVFCLKKKNNRTQT